MALDKLVGMTVFRQAVELGSLSAAGRAAGVSAEMAGQHLKALERRLGVRLLQRTTRRLDLTDAGRAFYGRCVAVLDEVALAEAEASARQTELTGRLRLAAPLAFGTAALAPALGGFLDRHPNLVMDVELSERAVDLRAEGFDLALRLGQPAPSSLVTRRLGGFPLVLVAAPAYLADRPAPGRPGDLAGHEALIYTQTHAPAHWSFERQPGGERQAVAIDGRIRASDMGFLLQLALGGRGILLAPSFVVQDDLAAGRLVNILPDWQERSLPLHALWPDRTLVPAKVRALIDFLRDWFGRPAGAGHGATGHPRS